MTGADGASLSDRAKAWFDTLREDEKNGTRTHIYCVIGLGTFGGTIATELMRFGNDVIGIDRDEKIVSDYADKLTQALIIDARDEQALKEAGVGDCHFGVVAMASDLEASILSTVNLKFVGVETIWAKALSRTHHRILTKLGVDRVVNPEDETGRVVAQMLHNPLIRDYAALGNGYYVVNFIVPEALTGRQISDIEQLPDNDLRALGIMRGTHFLGSADCTEQLEADDKLILLGTRADLRRFSEAL